MQTYVWDDTTAIHFNVPVKQTNDETLVSVHLQDVCNLTVTEASVVSISASYSERLIWLILLTVVDAPVAN